MSDRLEVVGGAGAVLRAGATVVWIGPTASARLLDFVVRAALALPRSPSAAQELADRILIVLRAGDPEPAAPFAVVGGGQQGMVALLHGPVQLWDGTRLSTPTPNPGWLAMGLGAPPFTAVGPAGSPARNASGSVFDLKEGVVPGSGFVLVPDPLGYAQSASDLRLTPVAVPLVSDPRATITPGAQPAAANAQPFIPAGAPQLIPPSVQADIRGLAPSDPGTSQPVAQLDNEPGALRPDQPGVQPTEEPGVQPTEEPVARRANEPVSQPVSPVVSPQGRSGWGPDPRQSDPGTAPVIPPPPVAVAAAQGPQPATEARWPAERSSEPAPGGRPGLRPTLAPSQRVPPPPPPPKPGTVAVGELASPALERPVVERGSAIASPNRSDLAERPAPQTVIGLRDATSQPGAPLPPVGTTPSLDGEVVVVSGVRCVRGHFNHPLALICVRCGGTMASGADGPGRGPRPPLGVVVRDDSTVFSLDQGYVLGSDPEADADVAGGLARPLRLAGSAAEEVSTVHAELRLNGWDVTVIDRGSAYGTFVLPPGEAEWERLMPNQAYVLTPGTHLACGQRILTFASPWPA